MMKIKVGIVGAAGYTGGELIRLLIHHPFADISFVHSTSFAGNFVHKIHKDLLGDTLLKFTNEISNDVDVIFPCVGHGEAKNIVKAISNGVRIIDLSQDHRYATDGEINFVYGLPELNRQKIKGAHYIANPGCFATAIQIALLPLANKSLLNSEIFISATTGSTGAGKSLSDSSHFSWRQNNISIYKPFVHQHLMEISNSLKHLQSSFDNEIIFVPQRGSFARGIFASIVLQLDNKLDELLNLFNEFYQNHPFVFMSQETIDLKQVVNTNKCLLYLEKNKGQLLIVSAIDNLLKGASGQAVQNMNLIFGFEETLGLKLKASVF